MGCISSKTKDGHPKKHQTQHPTQQQGFPQAAGLGYPQPGGQPMSAFQQPYHQQQVASSFQGK